MYIQEQKTLQKEFGFTAEDLAENRMGRLSTVQKVQMRRGARQLLFIALALLAVITTLILVFASPDDWEIQVIVVGLVLIITFILVDTVGITESAVSPGIVARVSGVAFVSNEDSYFPPMEHPFNYRYVAGRFSPNSLYVEGEQFQLTKQQCKAIPQGTLLDVYYIPTLRKILAVDIIKLNETDDLADVPVITTNIQKARFTRDDIEDVEPILG